jgi:hypothetical protein
MRKKNKTKKCPSCNGLIFFKYSTCPTCGYCPLDPPTEETRKEFEILFRLAKEMNEKEEES